MEKVPGAAVDASSTFQDLELDHKNKPVVNGPSYGKDNTTALAPLEKKNMADLAMERMVRKNGSR